ncbi:Eco57I restriction-modification methylase domain-containing protein [Mesomycoplasma ovipneumoniae]|uniref:Eco57I restriction-modification methylase domain-containing protein n=1 Tax=Mesomycoplasma ovipneumoniae TaxID=29562 RepID=UPI00311B381D
MHENVSQKLNGQVFTPDLLVDLILDQAGYKEDILKKHIIDNSCGNGQFLVKIIERYCKAFFRENSNLKSLKHQLETYIHGIDIDEKHVKNAIFRANLVIQNYKIEGVNWDFKAKNTLEIEHFNGKMDFVVGNPPYIRIHNLNNNKSLKNFNFSTIGMTDIYLAFYEIGIKMLSKNGILSYVSPSSFFTSKAGSIFREFLYKNKIIKSVVDHKHHQFFRATTYTTIFTIDKSGKNQMVDYYNFDNKTNSIFLVSKLEYEQFYLDNKFYFSTPEKLTFLKEIIYDKKKTDISVKNGLATLADSVFIGDFNFNSKYVLPVLKASNGKWAKIIFPYDTKNFQIISDSELKQQLEIFEHLSSFKEKLQNRSFDHSNKNFWYSFGRRQAISDTDKERLVVNSLAKENKPLKISLIQKNTCIYSGFYIISEKIDYKSIAEKLQSKVFLDFVELLGKYKNGGYYTFSTKDVKKYLDFMLGT